MIRIQDIRSLTDFHRNTKQHLRRLKRTGRPVVLTVNGRAMLVVQDATAYERLMRTAERGGRKSD
jgi:prevent-host-death family protein